MTANNPSVSPSLEKDEKINLGILFTLTRKFWWVIMISLLGCLCLGFLYLKKKNPTYSVNASYIVNDDDDNTSGSIGGGLGALMSSFSMGGAGYKSAEDEMYKLNSHDNMTAVVKELGLNKQYSNSNGFFSPKTLYYNDAPIEISAPEQVLDTISKATRFHLTVSDEGKSVSLIVKQPKDVVFEKEGCKFPITVKTPLATFTVDKTDTFIPGMDYDISASVMSPEKMATIVDKDFSISLFTKKSNIVEVSFDDTNVERGKDILNALIDNYNRESITDRQDFAARTVEFIDARLVQIYNDLNASETRIESYKRSNNIVDPDVEGDYIYKKKASTESELLALETKARVTEMAIDFLKSDANKYAMLPFTPDIPSDPVSAYNELIMQKMKLESNPTGNASALKVLNGQIDAMRTSMLHTLEKDLASSRYAIGKLNKETASTDSRISSAPSMEKDLLALYRDQKIQSQIYAFLLQKKEENEMTKARTTPMAKVIVSPFSDGEPVKPKPIVILALAFIFGLIFGYSISFYLYSRKGKSRV